MRKSVLTIAVIFIIATLGVLLMRIVGSAQEKNKKQDNGKTPFVEVQNPQRKTLYRTLAVPGDIMPNQEITIYGQVEGYLEKLNVDHGSWVEKDDVLALISIPDIAKQLEKEKADLSWKELRYNRAQKLVAESPDLISQDTVDELKGIYETAKAELEKTQELVNFATIKAPFAGIVTYRWIDAGELIQPGVTKILHLMQADPVRVRIYVPEPDVPYVAENSKAILTVDELPGKKWEANVSRFTWALNMNTKNMMVEIDIKNDKRDIRPGMFAYVTLNLEAHKDALTIPDIALVIERKKPFVFVIQDGVAKKIPIKIGIDNGIESEILEGLTDKDDIVIAGKNLISEGEEVKMVKRK